jgi:hypothetical protein
MKALIQMPPLDRINNKLHWLQIIIWIRLLTKRSSNHQFMEQLDSVLPERNVKIKILKDQKNIIARNANIGCTMNAIICNKIIAYGVQI